MILRLHSSRVVLHTMWQTTSGRKKAAFIHIDHQADTAGELDRDCHRNMMPYFRSENR